MSYRNEPDDGPVSRGRPRDTHRETEILREVLTCLAEVGYDRLSFEAVARRAGASKATLYRRWATKAEMVVAAVRSVPAGTSPPPIDTGTLRGDLLALLDRLARTLSTSDTGTVAALLQAGLSDPELCDHIESGAGPTGARLPAAVLRHAVDRGEVHVDTAPFAYDEVAASVLVLRALNGMPFDPAYREHLVDTVLLPALTAPPHPAPLAGLFAGHHPDTNGNP